MASDILSYNVVQDTYNVVQDHEGISIKGHRRSYTTIWWERISHVSNIAVTLVILSLELKPYYILLEGYRARPPGPEPQLEDSYTGRLLTSRRDTIAYGTIPCIDLRKEDLDGPSSLVRMCVKID